MKSTTVLMSEGTYGGKPAWRHYVIVLDEKTVIVDMVPAIFGWNVRGIETQQGPDAWPDMSADDIVAWKLKNHNYAIAEQGEAQRIIELVRSKGIEVANA